MHSSLGIPPMIQQQTPTLQTGWGIMGTDGQVHKALDGQYGSLTVNPETGAVDYKYHQNSGVQKTGSSTDHDVVDTFIIALAGDKNSQVEVDLHIHAQSTHGHSGHHIDASTLTGMEVTPIVSPQHDEPQSDESIDQVNLDLTDAEVIAPQDVSAEHAISSEHEPAPELHFDLSNGAALLDDAKADKAATATKEALEKVAGLLEEHPDSVEEKLVKLVENAPVKEPVPAEHAAPSHSADKTSEDGATHEPHADHADYVPPPSHDDDDDLHHDGTGLT